jgi:hypothetical protein
LIQTDSENKKSVYRRGQALYELLSLSLPLSLSQLPSADVNRLAKNDLDGAQRDLNVALAAFPTDRGVKDDLKKLAEKFKVAAVKVYIWTLSISLQYSTIHIIRLTSSHFYLSISSPLSASSQFDGLILLFIGARTI